ncbi:hypothetical protein [Paenarthrobacter sp. PH39-S1]|uniref:hypothetical protein n=1 Tax=Paenarthrobacter sp. PH39-S1 TaxID=3046204 RepID=UPI0024BA6D0C|nr:hypothetical protein [Paenarthrobacter sp. PH39-S1]MDJ0356600.1 hypothetical protein [Paenarthrobacter sp. PH39-S1]
MTWIERTYTRGEILFKHCPSRTDHPIQAPRWLNPFLTATTQNGLRQSTFSNFRRTDRRCKPSRHFSLIGTSELSKAKHRPDLSPVTLDCPSRPGIRPKDLSLNSNLLGNIIHRRRVEVINPAGESCLILEKLQQQREPQARGATLLTKQAKIAPNQSPFLNKPTHSTTIARPALQPHKLGGSEQL